MISQDEYSPPTQYAPGKYTFTREQAGTRYIVLGVRTLVDPSDPADLAKGHALQDALKVDQKSLGTFDVPNWDSDSQKTVREALIVPGTTLTDTSRAFGLKEEVDPIQRLVSAATTWGGNPRKDAGEEKRGWFGDDPVWRL
jgi:hypothetical protein